MTISSVYNIRHHTFKNVWNNVCITPFWRCDAHPSMNQPTRGQNGSSSQIGEYIYNVQIISGRLLRAPRYHLPSFYVVDGTLMLSTGEVIFSWNPKKYQLMLSRVCGAELDAKPWRCEDVYIWNKKRGIDIWYQSIYYMTLKVYPIPAAHRYIPFNGSYPPPPSMGRSHGRNNGPKCLYRNLLYSTFISNFVFFVSSMTTSWRILLLAFIGVKNITSCTKHRHWCTAIIRLTEEQRWPSG